jgi:hypothetical protein
VTSLRADAAAVRLRRGLADRRPLADPGDAAWLCALPCALVAVAAIALLGPALGRILYPSQDSVTYLAAWVPYLKPEHAEQARFLLSLGVPILLALATVLALRRRPVLSRGLVAVAVPAAQLLMALVVVAAVVAQRGLRFGPEYTRQAGLTIHWVYFTVPTLVVGSVLAAALVLALRSAAARGRAVAWLRESRARRAAAVTLAAAATVIWMLHAVDSDSSIANAFEAVEYHIGFTLDETFAVLNGRTPLVNFTAQYASLWPYAVALPMLVFGKTLLAFTIAMCSITAVSMLAIFDVLRRVARSALAALLLYLPFLATSFFMVEGTYANRWTFGNYFATFPLRYAAPYVLAWLTARRLGREGLGHAWPLFLVAGLTALNNADYGIPALGATVGALVWTSAGLERRALRRLAAEAAAGLVGALVLVCALTLLRAGSLPQFGRMLEFARIFAVGGFSMLPIPGVLGLHLVIYLTYVGAIGTATVRALASERDRVLTGMLAWTGIFGLGSASYYVGRSHPEALVATFSVWALALALLTVVVVRGLAAHPARRPAIAAVAVLVGFGVAACSLAQTPTPWSQVDRIRAPFKPTGEATIETPYLPPAEASLRTYVAALADGAGRFVYRRGAPVAVLTTTGHRLADAYGVVNVSPYTGVESIFTTQQLERTLDALRDAGGNTVVMPERPDAVLLQTLDRRGFRVVTRTGLRRVRLDLRIPGAETAVLGGQTLMKWVDTRHLRPAALR